MDRKAKDAACWAPAGRRFAGCRVESLIAVDERGQMVPPKELRDKAGIRGGDKFAVIRWEKGGKVCCLSLVKVEVFSGMVRGVLAPLKGDLLSRG